jgi:glycosyltransferase involved in cell wall biosynthesis
MKKMKILILNRRDIANPAGGGAEIYTHEIARGLTGKHGCEAVVFSSKFMGSTPEDIIDGVKYIRKGNEATVHLWGLIHAVKNRKKFDYIIDEFNGIGFFTFFLPNSILLIHQLYKEFWFRELGVIGAFPYVIESLLLKLYRRKLAITVSDSTKEDLRLLGFRDINVIMNAIRHIPSDTPPEKDGVPLLAYLGRLKSTKRPEDAIMIFKEVKKKIPDAKLIMLGRGPEEEKLKRTAKGLEGITFYGWVGEEEKFSLLRQAHLLLVPGVREGFGINVIEAAAEGTPAIGYDVPGLRDSIRSGETGYLVHSVEEGAARIVELLNDHDLYERMTLACVLYAKEFDWNKRVEEFWRILCRGK